MRTQKRIEKICEAAKISLETMEPPLLVADIATDHGYIAEALTKIDGVEKVIATDISEKSLSKLEKLKRLRNLGSIELKLGNGLEPIDKVCLCVIAGIGGFEIKKMIELQNGQGEQQKCKIFVLQPAQNATQLREWIFDNNFYVILDEVIEDNGRFFPIIAIDISRVQSNEKSIYNIWLGRDSSRNLGDFKLFLSDLNEKLRFLEGISLERAKKDEVLFQKYLLKKEIEKLIIGGNLC